MRFLRDWFNNHPRPPLQQTKPSDSGGLTLKELADQSDRRARQLNIDPPRPGRKTYQQRRCETRGMSTKALRQLLRERHAAGKEVGIILRELSERED